MKHREYVKGVVTGVMITAVAAVGINYVDGYLNGGVLADQSHVRKIEYLEKLIDQDYLGEKDEDKLAEGICAGLLYGLGDVYSRYYTADEYEQETSSTDGAYVGIGISMEKNKEGGVRIVECYEGGPGEKAGLKIDDVISAIDGEDITDKELSDVVNMIRKSGKDSVVLTVHRDGEENALEIETEISDVDLPSVFEEMLDDNTGYIRITEFKGNTPENYLDAFNSLEERGMDKLVIDLRDNPGGLLTSVCEILNHVLPEGLIVYTEDKNGKREEETCDGKNELDIPLAVLVNGNSASASEIFAGAVKDYGIGTIVGTTTYGKGVVQTIQPLTDGSAVKITIAKYFTPKGNDINKKGITPDVEAELSGDITDWAELTHEEDTQLQTALKELEQN